MSVKWRQPKQGKEHRNGDEDEAGRIVEIVMSPQKKRSEWGCTSLNFGKVSSLSFPYSSLTFGGPTNSLTAHLISSMVILRMIYSVKFHQISHVIPMVLKL